MVLHETLKSECFRRVTQRLDDVKQSKKFRRLQEGRLLQFFSSRSVFDEVERWNI